MGGQGSKRRLAAIFWNLIWEQTLEDLLWLLTNQSMVSVLKEQGGVPCMCPLCSMNCSCCSPVHNPHSS